LKKNMTTDLCPDRHQSHIQQTLWLQAVAQIKKQGAGHTA